MSDGVGGAAGRQFEMRHATTAGGKQHAHVRTVRRDKSGSAGKSLGLEIHVIPWYRRPIVA